mgnify:FL=1
MSVNIVKLVVTYCESRGDGRHSHLQRGNSAMNFDLHQIFAFSHTRYNKPASHGRHMTAEHLWRYLDNCSTRIQICDVGQTQVQFNSEVHGYKELQKYLDIKTRETKRQCSFKKVTMDYHLCGPFSSACQ